MFVLVGYNDIMSELLAERKLNMNHMFIVVMVLNTYNFVVKF